MESFDLNESAAIMFGRSRSTVRLIFVFLCLASLTTAQDDSSIRPRDFPNLLLSPTDNRIPATTPAEHMLTTQSVQHSPYNKAQRPEQRDLDDGSLSRARNRQSNRRFQDQTPEEPSPEPSYLVYVVSQGIDGEWKFPPKPQQQNNNVNDNPSDMSSQLPPFEAAATASQAHNEISSSSLESHSPSDGPSMVPSASSPTTTTTTEVVFVRSEEASVGDILNININIPRQPDNDDTPSGVTTNSTFPSLLPSRVPTSGSISVQPPVTETDANEVPSPNNTPLQTNTPSDALSVGRPSGSPSRSQTSSPSGAPVQPTSVPSRQPTPAPTSSPTIEPSASPSISKTSSPSGAPVRPTSVPSRQPTPAPTNSPTTEPSTSNPSSSPTSVPSTSEPTFIPTNIPTRQPTPAPTNSPTTEPSTSNPSSSPTSIPSTSEPTFIPTSIPTRQPTPAPTSSPSIEPSTSNPSSSPTSVPSTSEPSSRPTRQPTPVPTSSPTIEPSTSNPSSSPTSVPLTSAPTFSPTIDPSDPTEFVVVDEVALHTTSETVMSAEDIAIFELVCQTEFLPVYLPLTYNSSNFTEIDCTVVDQNMVEGQRRRMLTEEQHHLQNADVLLKSSTTNILVHVASVMNPMPKDDASFDDIVAMTFWKYSEEFQALLSEQTSYFIAQPKNVPSDAIEETRNIPVNSDTIPIIYIAVAAVGGAIIVFGFALLAIRRRQHNMNKMVEMPGIEVVNDDSEISVPRRQKSLEDEIPRFLVTCNDNPSLSPHLPSIIHHDHEVPTKPRDECTTTSTREVTRQSSTAKPSTEACETVDGQVILLSYDDEEQASTPSSQHVSSPPQSPSHLTSLSSKGSPPAVSFESYTSPRMTDVTRVSSPVSLQDGPHRTASETSSTNKSYDNTLGHSEESATRTRRRRNSTRKYYNRIQDTSQSRIDGDKRPPRISASAETDVSSLLDPCISISRTGSRNTMLNTSESIEVSSTPRNGISHDDSNSRAFTIVDYSCSDTSSPQSQLLHLSTVDITKSPIQVPIRLKSVKEDDVLTTVTGDSRAEFRVDDLSLDQKESPKESILSKGRNNFEPESNNGSRSIAGSSGETSSMSSGGGGSSKNNFVTVAKTTILNSVRQTALFSAFGNYTFSSNSSSNSIIGRSNSIRTEDYTNGTLNTADSLHTAESIEVSTNNNNVITISHSSGSGSGGEDKSKSASSTTPRREPTVDVKPTRTSSPAVSTSSRPPRPPAGGGAVSRIAAGQGVDLTEMARKDHVGI